MKRLVLLALVPVLTGCSGLSREINQALPEFLRSEPGEEEMKIFRDVSRARGWTEDDLVEQDRAVEDVRQFRKNRNWDDAVDRIEEYLEAFPVSRHDENMRFWLGDSRYQDDQWQQAYAAWREFSLLYPLSDYSLGLTETLYSMGQAFLSGERSGFLGIFSRKGVGVKILNHIVEAYPAMPRAPDAQWSLAQYHVKEEEWAEGEAAFHFIVDQYEPSEWYQPALYYVAYCRYRQVKGPAQDPQMMLRAQESFERYLTLVPDGEWREDAGRIAAQLEELRAEHLLGIGEWYLGQGKPYTARFYLTSVVTRFPQSESAKRARELLPPEEVPDKDADEGANKTVGNGGGE